MPRRRKPEPAPRPHGIRWRKGRAYYECQHRRLEGGRLLKSLATRDGDLAQSRAAAVNTLMDRGDWAVIERWRADEIDISDIARAVRDGDYLKLRRLDGTRLGVAVKAFLRTTEAARKPNTAANYSIACTQLVEALGKDFVMASLTREQAQEFLHSPKDTAKGQPWATATLIDRRTIYGALWKSVIEDERERATQGKLTPATVDNPWPRVKVAERRTTRHVFLSTERWHTLIAHPTVAGTPTAAFLACGCLAGLRQQEIANLRTGIDVDLEAGVLRVQDRKGRHAWTAKRATSQRDVPVVPALRRLLEEHIAAGYAGERYFFHAPGRDRPLSARTAIEWTERAFKAAGIAYGRTGEALTLHSLRHTFASWLVLDGVPFTVVASLMGDVPATVIKFYAHLASDDREAAMLRIQERVG